MILRGLTLWRPWAASIVHGPKRVENRPWAPPTRLLDAGLWLALHAGRTWDIDGAEFIIEHLDGQILGLHDTSVILVRDDARAQDAWPLPWIEQGIVGVARVVRAYRYVCPPPTEALEHEWSFGPWCWELADVQALPEPIPCRGRQSLWELDRVVYDRLAPLCVAGSRNP